VVPDDRDLRGRAPLTGSLHATIARLLGARLAARLRADPEIEPRVAEAMIAALRHRFVRWRYLLRAYHDCSLPTGDGTSISQPTYIAKVISAARIGAEDRVLEIGAGSGYAAAVMGRLAREVVTVERVVALAEGARRRLAAATNVRVVTGDGCHDSDGTFDAILVMAGAPSIPHAYRERLRDGGRLIIPVGERSADAIRGRVLRVTRRGETFLEEDLMAGDWNSLTGRDGWTE
jgi:protein-L-isoaspartate(D-aspartate) O-methyltransferase